MGTINNCTLLLCCGGFTSDVLHHCWVVGPFQIIVVIATDRDLLMLGNVGTCALSASKLQSNLPSLHRP